MMIGIQSLGTFHFREMIMWIETCLCQKGRSSLRP